MTVTMPSRITFLYSNIGRGHPFYLDGVLESLIRRGSIGIVKGQTDVFAVSRGLSRRAWRLAHWLYRKGSSGGVVGSLYFGLRRDANFNRPSLGLKVLGHDIRKVFGQDEAPLVVDHPTLVGILRDRPHLIYQHGELVAPPESVVNGASTVCVPTDAVADAFRAAGYQDDQIFVSGLCIELSLVRQAESAFQTRMNRLDSRTPLTGAFFSSGAEPDAHVAALCEACLAIAQEGGRAIVFAAEGGKLHGRMSSTVAARGLEDHVITTTDFLPQDLPPVLIAAHKTRREETALTSRLFPYFDYFVAPSHERTNWALGLGLPMFVLLPTVGEFARRNCELLRRSSVAELLDDHLPPATLGVALRHLRREGHLRRMAENGWGRENINGFTSIADMLIHRYGG